LKVDTISRSKLFQSLEEDINSVFLDRSELSKIYHLNLSENSRID